MGGGPKLSAHRDYSNHAVEFEALRKKTSLASTVGAPVETNAQTTRDVIMLLHSVILDFRSIDTRNKVKKQLYSGWMHLQELWSL